MNKQFFHFFRNIRVLEEEVNASPVLSEFFESIQLIRGNVFSLFASKDISVLQMKSMKVETTSDIYKKKIIYYCKNIDSSQVMDLLASISDVHMQKIGAEFFFATSRKFAKNQSIQNFSKFLFLMFQHFDFDSQFLKGFFFTINRESNECLALINYMKRWDSSKLKNSLHLIIKNTINYLLERFALFCQFDDFFSLFDQTTEFLEKEDQSEMRKLLLSVIQSILYKNLSLDLFKKSVFFFEEKGLVFDSLCCNKVLDVVNKYLRENNFLEFMLSFMEKRKLTLNIVTYNIIMDYYCMTNQFKTAYEIFNTLESKQIKPDSFTYSILIKGIKNMTRPDFQIASRLFQLYREENEIKDIIIFNSILDVFITTGDIVKANEIFEMIKENKDLVPDQITFNTLIKGCCKAKDFDNALKYFNLMKENNLKPNRITYNSLMDLAVKIQKLPEALKLVVEMQKDQISSDGFTYSIILNGLKLNDSNLNLVKLSLNNIEKVIKSNSFKQDEVLFNSILDVCSKYELYDEMKKFYLIMKEKDIKESSITCSILIKAYSKTHDFETAFDFFEKMIQSNMKITDLTYGSILDACAKNGNMNIAMKIYNSLLKNQINLNSIVFTTILKGFCKNEAFDEALVFFKEVKHHTELPGMIITYNCALDILTKKNNIEAIIELFEEIDAIFKADLISYSTVIKALCVDKKELALEYVKKMIQAKITVDVSVVNLFLENCSNKNDYKLAIKGYQYSMMQNIIPNEITFGIMIKIYGFARELYKAFDLLDLMDAYEIKPSIIIYTNLIHISFYNRKVRKAELAFTLLRKQKIRGDTILYSKLIDGLIRFRDINKVPKYIDYAIKDNCCLKQDTIVSILKHFNEDEMKDKIKIIQGFKQNEKFVNNFNNKIQNQFHIENPKKFKKIIKDQKKNENKNEEDELNVKKAEKPFVGRTFKKPAEEHKKMFNNYNNDSNNTQKPTTGHKNNGMMYTQNKPMQLFNFRQKKTA